MNDRHSKFAQRQEERKRRAQTAAVINAELMGRRNQRLDIDRWAEKVQAQS